MDINTDTTPALHAGSAVRANPLHTIHSTLDIFYITLQIRGKKQQKNQKQIKTENNNNNNNKHNNKKPQSISAPQDPTPQKKEKKMNTHPRNKSKVKHAQSDYIRFSLHYCTM